MKNKKFIRFLEFIGFVVLKNSTTSKNTITSINALCFLLSALCSLLFAAELEAKVTGVCSNCHTMHNSQSGAAMATYGADGQPWKGSGNPISFLLRGSCLGCHGMGTANKIVAFGGSNIPQVYHIDSSGDLAAGNFAYIIGTKGDGASDRKGHNVIDLGNLDDFLTVPPGQYHDHGIRNTNLTCAGTRGCHGTRNSSSTKYNSLKGAHHGNVEGRLDNPTENYNSYRFLRNVKGLENPGVAKWQNNAPDSHNEYFGATTPLTSACGTCHVNELVPPGVSVMVAKPASGTMSNFCGTCHGNFYTLEGIGNDVSSPFVRHPTDVFLKGTGEYAGYVYYSVIAPVARTTVPAAASDIVQPGTDVIMCLSCHGAHATNYEHLMRWDYKGWPGNGQTNGCNVCHTSKN